MTGYRGITRVQVDFVNRDGVPTAFIMDGPEVGETYLEVDVHEDGLHADIDISQISLPNDGKNYRFASLENLPHVVAVPMGKPEPAPLGKAGQIIVTVVALAILTPFVAILWAWAGQVYRSFG